MCSVALARAVCDLTPEQLHLQGPGCRCAQRGTHVWAEKFDGELEELFNIQNEIVGRISVAVAQGVERYAFHALRQRPANWRAYEIAVEADQMASDAFNRSDLALRELAMARAQEALARDPHSSMARTTPLIVLWQTLFFSTASDREATLEQAVEHLRLARGMQTEPEIIGRRLQILASGAERCAAGRIDARTAGPPVRTAVNLFVRPVPAAPGA